MFGCLFNYTSASRLFCVRCWNDEWMINSNLFFRKSCSLLTHEALNLFDMEVCYWALIFTPFVILHHLLNVSVQLANKRGLKKIWNEALLAQWRYYFGLIRFVVWLPCDWERNGSGFLQVLLSPLTVPILPSAPLFLPEAATVGPQVSGLPIMVLEITQQPLSLPSLQRQLVCDSPDDGLNESRNM
jgi:hypothetical protein